MRESAQNKIDESVSGGYMSLEREAAGGYTFDVVFAAHYDYVYNLTHALLRNDQDAEDATQEAFMRVYKSLHTFQAERGALRSWLTKIAINVCQNHRRRNFLRHLWDVALHHSDEAAEAIDYNPWGAPEEQALRAELRHIVKDLLGTLTMESRTVLVLYYYLDMSCTQIASVLDCPEGTVHSRLYHGRRIIQAKLEAQAMSPRSEA